jgi:hypothetical protein
MLAELDMQPLQHSWWTHIVRFFNAAVGPDMDTASPLMAAALRADMALATQPGEEAQRTWSGQLLRALGALGPGTDGPGPTAQPTHLQSMARDLLRLPLEEIQLRLSQAYAREWCTDEPHTLQPGTRPRDPRNPLEPQPRRAMYNSWFRPTAGVIMRESARHTSSSANRRTQANLRFRLGCYALQPCSRCGHAGAAQPLADAFHVCFECQLYDQELEDRGLTGRPPGVSDFTSLYSSRPRSAAFRYIQAVSSMLE